MPDILKITTPVVSKADPQTVRQAQDAAGAFDLQNIQKIVKNDPQSEILKQNTGMLQKDEAPTVLMNMLKDPSMTVGVLKNIFMLQEIIQLLPVNNTPLTQEIEQMFNALLVTPEEIAPEMQRQEDASTLFRGELFDFLRTLVTDRPNDQVSPELKSAVGTLLKSLNSYMNNQDVLDAVANTLQFLGKSAQPSRELSARLLDLSARFRAGDAPQQFSELKSQVLSVLKELEDSILFTPKMQKVASITVYNLSRYSDNPDFLQEATSNLLIHLDVRQRQQFQRAFASFFAPVRKEREQESNIMDVLAKILDRQAQDEDLNLVNAEKIEKIIHSLLSSPCNFTPLLHYVVPVQSDMMKAFAEMWINPNGQDDEPERRKGGGKALHVLTVFDIQGIGRFEVELYVQEKNIDVALFCPPGYLREFQSVRDGLAACVANSSYRVGDIRIDKLEHTRSLMDVFKSLPYKRTGVNVKI